MLIYILSGFLRLRMERVPATPQEAVLHLESMALIYKH